MANKMTKAQSAQQEKERTKKWLEELLKDDGDLRALSKWKEKINIFDILQSAKTEIRHSKVLAWLLTVDGNHALGEAFVREFIKTVIKKNTDKSNDIFEWSFVDYTSQIVLTEQNNIDILVRFEGKDAKYVIAIENKTKTTEHKAGKSEKLQTDKYKEFVDNEYADYKKMYVYLTSMDDTPKNKAWCVISYEDVLSMIEAVRGKGPSPQAALIIDNYCDLIKKSLIGRDGDLFRECQEVYGKHPDAFKTLFDYCKNNRIKTKDPEMLGLCNRIYALYEQELDLVYENKEDETALLVEWLVDNIGKHKDFVLCENSNKTYVTFTSQRLNELIPSLPNAESSWGTKNTYQFWFYTVDYKKDKRIKLAIELGGDHLTEESKRVHETVIKKMKPSNKSPEYTYKIVRSKMIDLKKFWDGKELDDLDFSRVIQPAEDWVEKFVENLKKPQSEEAAKA